MARTRNVATLVFLVLLGAAAAFAYHGWRARARRAGYGRAVALFDRGEYAAALGPLQAVYRAGPASPEGVDALCRACVCLEETGRGGEATDGWAKVISSPAAERYRARAALALARASLRGGRADEARRHLDAFPRGERDSPLAAEALAVRALILEREGDLDGALAAAAEAGRISPAAVMGEPGGIFVRALLSRTVTPGTEEYEVRAGDSLQAVARRYGTTVELLRRMNAKEPGRDSLRVGERLKVSRMRFSILIDKSENTLLLLADGRPAKLYRVGTGKKGSTPAGDFRITLKQEKPEWFRPGGGVIPYGDPENLLGTRWMAIDSPGYGIHGTWEPDSVGKQSSAGCVRMVNDDVEELYGLVPVGTPVKITE